MQNSVRFSIGSVIKIMFVSHYTRFLSTFGLSFVSLPPRYKINYVTISRHRKELLEIYSFFCSLVALHKSHKTKYVGLVCGGEIVTINFLVLNLLIRFAIIT